jgi:nucleoside-diphosphate-sugar epimerase
MKRLDESVLVTGATGFVGRALVAKLLQSNVKVVAVVRRLPLEKQVKENNPLLKWVAVGDLNGQTDWRNAFRGSSTVVHCAARAHVMADHRFDSLEAYREVNVAGTLRLAQQAMAAGIRRFVFISSIKVNGERTEAGKPFSEINAPNPQDPYGKSKAEAESGLLALAKYSSMEVVIIRPPLVIGPGVKGNMASMFRVIELGVPLPFGAVKNQRSFVSLINLVDLLLLCSDRERSPNAANQIFIVSDFDDLSTPMLIGKIAQGLGRSARLFSVPPSIIWKVSILVGKGLMAERLLGNLQVRASKVREILGWQPLVSVDQQLSVMFNKEESNF